MSTLAQRSFSAGEIAPAVYARVDQVRYITGLRTCRNFIVQRWGGVANRPGTTFDAEAKDSTKVGRLIPFIYNNAQAYALEFGDLYMRVHQNGQQVTETAKVITGATQANPCSVTCVAHGYSTGDEVYISGILGMTTLNGRNFKVVSTGANTFTLKYMDGTAVDSTGFAAYTSDGTAARIYTLVTPYLAADLALLKFSESADVVTLTHPSYRTRELSRLGNTNWTLTLALFAPATLQPVATIVAGTGGGGVNVTYKVTAVNQNGEESLPGTAPILGTITAISLGAQIMVTVSAGLIPSAHDEIYLSGIVGTTELNGNVYIVSDRTATTFKLKDRIGNYVDGSAFTPFISSPPDNIIQQTLHLASGAVASASAPNEITISLRGTVAQQSQIRSFNIYKSTSGENFGFIGSASLIGGTFVLFNDVGAAPDTTDQPPEFTNPFPTASDQPSCVAMYQQRRCYGNTINNPELAICSKIGSYRNFTKSIPSKDDDSVSFTPSGDQVNAIKHLVALGELVIFTQAGEHSVAGDSGGALTPSSINLRQHSYCGASDLRPLVSDAEALFVQARGNKVRSLAFDWQVNGYRGSDLSIFSNHLFEGYTLVDWTLAQVPNSTVWAVRSDGKLIGFTYIREQQIAGWHHHDFDGTVENVCAIPESGEDYLYLLIKRTINGRSVRCIERMASRTVVDVIDYIGMDCSLSFDGRNVGATTMTLTGGTNWDYTENLTLTASASTFASGDVGKSIHLTGSDGTLLRLTITTYSSATVVTVKSNKTVPVAMRSVASSTWAKAISSLGGLWHLEGKSVSVLGDRFVAASPNNADNATVVVANGIAVLDETYSVIHAGLPITSDFETLDPDTTQGETMIDKKKYVGKLTMIVEKSRGVFAGATAPDPASSDPLSGLEELKIRGDDGESMDNPVALKTGTVEIVVNGTWNNNGRVFVRQVDPLPLTILGVAPAGYFPART